MKNRVSVLPPPRTYVWLFAAALLCVVPCGAHGASKVGGEEQESGWYENLFASGSVQYYFALGELSGYVATKPGWRAGAGWSLFHTERHSFPIYIEAGHSVIAGTNPLVRALDVWPVELFAGYEYMPLPLLSVDVALGAGPYFASISHYQTALDLIQGNMTNTSGHGMLFSVKAGAGVNLFKKSVELRLYGSLDCIWEKAGIIPLAGISFTLSVFPGRIYAVLTEPPQTQVIEIEVEKPVEVKTVVEIEVETVVEVEVPFALSDTFFVLFEPDSAELTDDALVTLDHIATLMQKYPDTNIFITGSAAPFGSEQSQLDLAEERSVAIADWLEQDCGIDRSRLVIRRPVPADKGAQDDRDESVQLRSVTIQVYQ